MKKYLLIFLAAAAVLKGVAEAESESCSLSQESSALPLSSFFFQASRHFGETLVTDSDSTLLGIYSVPNLCKCRIGFLGQAELSCMDDGDWNFCGGLGLRMRDQRLNWIWGVNSFYQNRRTNIGHLNDVIIGFETITPCFELRLNYELPIGQNSIFSSPFFYDGYIGDYSVSWIQEDYLYHALDLTLGQYFNLPCCFTVYGSLGSYYIWDRGSDNSWGFQARAEVWWTNFFYGGVYSSYDGIFRSKTEGYIGISLPLDYLCNWRHAVCGGKICDGCDPGRWCNGRNGRAARIRHLGGVLGSCCYYDSTNF